jgi:alginate O-acetyltransferase complex protein AlgJ
VAPDKESIYPEYLPSWVKKIRPQTKLDQFFAYMRTNSTVPVLDLRDVVLDAKANNPTYLKTDTHWNFFGGFIAYQKLVQTLAGQLPALNLQPMPATDFTITNWLTPGGDMVRIMGLSMTESNAYFMFPKPGLPKFTQKTARPDHPKDIKYTINSQAKGQVVFFHDSFARTWFEFLAYNFNQVTYLWQYDLDPVWIEKNKPDLVVSEMLERFFDIQDPKELMAKEALN